MVRPKRKMNQRKTTTFVPDTVGVANAKLSQAKGTLATSNPTAQGSEMSVMYSNMHDYGAQCEAVTGGVEDFPPLPISPAAISPAAKLTRVDVNAGAAGIDEVTATIMKEFSFFNENINKRLDTLQSMLRCNSIEIADMKKEMKDTTREVAAIKHKFKAVHEDFIEMRDEVKALAAQSKKDKEKIKTLERKLMQLENYTRRQNLKIYGLEEKQQENVREETVRLCQELLPEARDQLAGVIDIAHRLGPRKTDSTRPRAVIVRFSHRYFRDAVWRAGKGSTFLRSRHLKLAEDLSPEERENRRLLYPAIAEARKDNRPAYFLGGRAFINGKEIFPPEHPHHVDR